MVNLVRNIALAWIIVIGGLMITPNGIFYIACNPGLLRTLGAISIGMGVAAVATSRQNSTVNG